MRRTKIVLVSCAALLTPILSAVPGQAQTAQQADVFVRNLYGHYERLSDNDNFYVLGKQASSFFSPGLLALIRKEEKATPPGDSGKLDWDPVCNCQDDGGLKLVDVQVIMRGADRALATAVLSYPNPGKMEIRLYLLWTARGWRIDDIGTKDTPSLRKYLLSPEN
jgi:hypothetical protein